MSKIYSNIVDEETVRKKQSETLNIIADSLSRSFGPMGSHTAIVKNLDENGCNVDVKYTKDGHTIIKNIVFKDTIERSVQDLLTELTRYIVKEVGDGTTSAIILCKTIFDALCRNSAAINNCPADTIKRFSEVIKEAKERILNRARECTIEDIYNIALVSTNNNKEIASILRNVYEKYGMDVYIDIGISNELNTVIKEYDGMTLETGFSDMCFVNNKADNTATVNNPKVYAFYDPIDTPEMLGLLDQILYNNIIRCFAPNSPYVPVPTVILSKRITPDASSYLKTVVEIMNSYDNVPLLMVSDIHQDDLFEDIALMTGAPFIKKYLNPDLQKEDVERGLAPTIDTVVDFCGEAEAVVSDQMKTKFIKPKMMFNEDGSYSDAYNSTVKYLETQITKAKNDSESIDTIYRLKRRYNSFKGNMIDLLIGGVTLADRENLKAAVEDAVSNCRSAARYGVGYGANFMALSTFAEMKTEDAYVNNGIVKILNEAYYDLCKILYRKTCDNEDAAAIDIVKEMIKEGKPLNIRTNEYDGKILSSIRSDIVILETIDNILTMMFTCNQYLVQAPVYNIY